MERWTPVPARLYERDNPIGGGEPFCRTKAWEWMLHHAQHRDSTLTVDGIPLMLKRGEILCSLRWVAQQWGWSVKKVRTFLEQLHEMRELEKVRGTRKGTVFRLMKYDDWLGRGHSDGHGTGTGRAQVVRESHQLSQREDAPGDVEKPPGQSSGPLDKSEVRPEALEAARTLDGFNAGAELSIHGTYGANGTQQWVWNGVAPERRPDLISTALLRVASDSDTNRWSSRFFGIVLRNVIEEELAPSPAEQAKARSAKSPAGRLTAEQEAEREAERKAQSRARQTERDMERATAEQEEADERAREVLSWLAKQPTDVQQSVENEAKKGLQALGFRNPPKPMLQGYVIQAAERVMQEAES